MTQHNRVKIPQSAEELLTRAQALAGHRLADLAEQTAVTLPQDLRHAKGYIGQFLEILLGAHAASKAQPDFPDLGIELKTLPISPAGKPLESTFVTTIPLMAVGGETWHSSVVYQKLRHVLWIPIVIVNDSIHDRRVGQPLLWKPSEQDEQILAADWQELTDRICLGALESISAKLGHYLQVRPKGANAKSLVWGVSESGERILTLPRGFYLRPSFTGKILREHFLF